MLSPASKASVDKTSGLRVLIANDERTPVVAAVRALRAAWPELEIVYAADAVTFADRLDAGAVDLVIVELRLAWADALAIVRDAKVRHPECAVVMLAGRATVAAAVAAMKAGADDVVLGGTPQRLVAAVRAALDAARTRRAERAAVERLQVAAERYRIVSELTSDFPYAFRVEPDGSLVREWLGRGNQILGYAPDEFDARGGWAGVIHPDDFPLASQAVARLLANQQVITEYRYVTKNGDVQWLRSYARPIWDDAQQRVVAIYGAAEDVTARRRVESALEESEARYRAVSELVSDFACALRVEADGSLFMEWATGALARITGYDIGALRHSDTWPAYFQADDLAVALQHRDRVFAGKPDVCEFRIVAKDGTLRWLRSYARPMLSEQEGRVVRIYAAVQDVTGRKVAEAQLRESLTLLRAISEGTTDAVFVKDTRGRYLLINSAGARLLDQPVEQVLGKDDTAFFSPETAQAIIAGDRRVMQAGVTQTYEEVGVVGGTRRVYLATKGVYRDDHGAVIGLIGISRDITARKAAEDALRESEARFRAVAETANAVIFIQGETYRYVNPATERISGYSRDELLAMNYWDIAHPESREVVMQRAAALQRGETDLPPQELAIVTKAGAVRWLDATATMIEIQGRPALLGIGFDITDRKHAEEALRRNEERYRNLVEYANDMVFTFDTGLRFTWINRATERITGYSAAEALTMTVNQVVAPEELAHVSAAIARQWAGELTPGFETVILAKDGRRVAIDISAHTMYRDGQPFAIQGIARDVTERKRGEADKAALLDVARDIGGTLDRQALLDRVQRRTLAALPCDAIGTFHWDAERNAFRLIAHSGLTPDLVPAAEAIEFQAEEPRDTQLTSGQTLVLNEIPADHWVRGGVMGVLPITALAAAPLLVRGRYYGSYVVCNFDPHRRFAPTQVELLEGIARQLAVGIEACDLYTALSEEAAVSGALARVGRELISSLETPVLLDRLCRLTTEVLTCDVSRTYLSDAGAEAFVPAARWGDTAEEWEALRVLKIPRALVAGLTAQLERDELAVLAAGAPELFPGDVVATAYLALRRGREIVGVQSIGWRARHTALTPQQQRVARGIAQLASVALTNARLVAELERANSVKSDFVATMSHELRTPLNIILGYNGLLLEGEFGPLTDDQAIHLGYADRSAHELMDLINATLDLSRLETRRLPLEVSEITVADLLRELHGETQPVPGLDCRWQVEPAATQVRTDRVKLKVVLKNLLGNAVKFTRRGRVAIVARPRDDGVEFTVSDTGIGIAADLLPIIFEPFRQGDSSATRHYGGVGLGLYIVRRLLDVLGGTISVESVAGQGSTFHVWVPTVASGMELGPPT